MASHKEGLDVAYLMVLQFGVLENIFLLYIYSLNFFTDHRKRPITLLIINLAFAHILMILFRGIPMIINRWGWRFFLNDIMEKILTYIIRVTRGISLCNTCLLSVFQAIIISPRNVKWTKIKKRAPKYILPCCLLSWIFNLLLNIIGPVNVNSSRNCSEERWRIGHISFGLHAINIIKILIWKSTVDALFVTLMIWSSVYMVFVLYRHNQQVQHIHNMSLSPRTSPEIRATKAILMLVIIFVCFNAASSPFIIYIASARINRHWALPLTVTLSLFYPIVSPLILISIDTQIPKSFGILLGLKMSFQ